jgi:hypothetical protein
VKILIICRQLFKKLVDKLVEIFTKEYYLGCNHVMCYQPADYIVISVQEIKIHSCKEHVFNLVTSEKDKIRKVESPEEELHISSYFS